MLRVLPLVLSAALAHPVQAQKRGAGMEQAEASRVDVPRAQRVGDLAVPDPPADCHRAPAYGEPLFVLDGQPLPHKRMVKRPDGYWCYGHPPEGANPISLLEPGDILGFDVLREDEALRRFGPRGAHGAVSVTTRRRHPPPEASTE